MQHTTSRARATLYPEGVLIAAPWHATKTPALVESLKIQFAPPEWVVMLTLRTHWRTSFTANCPRP